MKRVFKVLLVLLVAMMPMFAVNAKTKTTTTTADTSKPKINFYVFYGAECGHCADLSAFLTELEKDSEYNYMYNLVKYETWHNSENASLMVKVFNYFGVTDEKQMGVPLYVIGDFQSSGFPSPSYTENYEAATKAIKEAIKKAYNNANYKDLVAGIGQGTIDITDADKTEDSKKTNDIIGYVIIGIVVIVIIAIIFGRSKSDTYYPVEDDEDEEVEEKAEEVKPVATKVAVKKPAAKKTTTSAKKTTTAKKTTKTTSAKKTTTKKNTKKK